MFSRRRLFALAFCVGIVDAPTSLPILAVCYRLLGLQRETRVHSLSGGITFWAHGPSRAARIVSADLMRMSSQASGV